MRMVTCLVGWCGCVSSFLTCSGLLCLLRLHQLRLDLPLTGCRAIIMLTLPGESMTTRVDAADRLLASGPDAPKSVLKYAAAAVKRWPLSDARALDL